MTPSLSIIIPTRHRPDILRQCLEHLSRQTIAEQLEMIVVHDGEDDAETKALLANPTTYHLPPTTYLSIPKSQQGTARNRGVERATADRVLFLGDDMFLEEDACEKHAPYPPAPFPQGEKGGVAILGFVAWDPAVGITPAMRWLDRTGWQFGYRFLEQYAHGLVPRAIQHRFTYTNQLSLPTNIARAHPFREDLSLYGWEDILWGEELRDADISLFYEPSARGLHHHKVTLEDSLRRMETLGRSVRHIEKIFPGFDRVPRGFKLLLYRLAALLPTMGGRHRRAFLRGLNA